MNSEESRTRELQAELEQYTGSETFTRITPGLIATEGAIAFAQKVEAFWLLQNVGIALATGQVPRDSFYDVKLLVKFTSAVMTIGDGNGNTYYSETISFTDCPTGEFCFFVEQCDEHEWCILLPSEH